MNCTGFNYQNFRCVKDSEAERTVIMEKIYPELKELCVLHGRDFQMFDPHWGLTDAVTDDHSLASVCLQTLDKCTHDHLQPINIIVSECNARIHFLRLQYVVKLLFSGIRY